MSRPITKSSFIRQAAPLGNSRRSFIKRIGAGIALLPMLDLELEGRALAAPPKRFVSMVWPNGVTKGYWPTGTETDFKLGEAMSSLEPVKSDIVILDDISLTSFQEQQRGEGGHTSLGQLLTGGRGGVSIDQHIASKSKGAAIPSLVLAVDTREETKPPLKYVSFNPGAVSIQDEPYKLYAKLFGNAEPGMAGAPTTGASDALARIRAERKSILDYLGKDLQRFGTPLGTEDRQKVDAHLVSIREIEKQLDQLGAGMPGGQPGPLTGPPAIEKGLNPYDKKSYDKLSKIQLDTVVAALAANATNVASMIWNSSHNNVWVFYWLGDEFSQPGRNEFNKLRNHHEIAHHAGSGDDLRRKNMIDNWFMGRMAYLLQEMKRRKEGNGTLLDNSLVLWANCMDDGGSHGTSRMPFVLGGRAGGALKTGRYVKQGKKVPHNGLLVSIANMMDAPVQTFGPAQYGGALANL